LVNLFWPLFAFHSVLHIFKEGFPEETTVVDGHFHLIAIADAVVVAAVVGEFSDFLYRRIRGVGRGELGRRGRWLEQV